MAIYLEILASVTGSWKKSAENSWLKINISEKNIAGNNDVIYFLVDLCTNDKC